MKKFKTLSRNDLKSINGGIMPSENFTAHCGCGATGGCGPSLDDCRAFCHDACGRP